MITWVLTEEPTEAVAMAIGIVEARLDTDAEVQWVCPTAEPVQD